MNQNELIAEVIAARQTAADIAATLKTRREEWEAANLELIASNEAAKVALSEAEAALRKWSEVEYAATGNKKPAPGCTSRRAPSGSLWLGVAIFALIAAILLLIRALGGAQ